MNNPGLWLNHEQALNATISLKSVKFQPILPNQNSNHSLPQLPKMYYCLPHSPTLEKKIPYKGQADQTNILTILGLHSTK